MLSESAARHYWPGADPIGKRLLMGEKLDLALSVVGIVPDTRYRDLRDARPSIYFPLRQSFFPFEPTTLAIRTLAAPGELVPAFGARLPRQILVSRWRVPRHSQRFSSGRSHSRDSTRFCLQCCRCWRRTRRDWTLWCDGNHGASTDARARCTNGARRHRTESALHGNPARASDRRSRPNARPRRSAAHEPPPSALLYDVSPTDAVTLAVVAGMLLSVALLASCGSTASCTPLTARRPGRCSRPTTTWLTFDIRGPLRRRRRRRPQRVRPRHRPLPDRARGRRRSRW